MIHLHDKTSYPFIVDRIDMAYSKAADLLELALEIAARHHGMSFSEIDERSEGPTQVARRRNTQRMVRAMERLLGDHVRTGNDDRGKYVLVGSDRLRGLIDLKPDELSALDHGIELLVSSNALGDAQSLKKLRGKVRLLQPPRTRGRIEVDHEAILQSSHVLARPGPRQKIDPASMSLLSEALLALRQISFSYSGGDGVVRRRTVHPYGIIAGHRAYLAGRNVSRVDGEPALWLIDRMTDISILEEPADRPDQFDIRAFSRRSFGVFHDESEYGEVEWRFRADVADRVINFGFHPDQVVSVAPDGSVTVRFFASGILEMAWALYPWGDSVDVIKPDALKKLVSGYQRSDFSGVP